LTPGKYYVYHKVVTTYLCEQEFSDSFVVAPYPVIRTSLPNDTAFCANSPLSLNSTISGGVQPYHYQWNTALKDSLPQLDLFVETDTMLIITVSDKYGCYHRDTVLVDAYPLPENKIEINDHDQCFKGNTFVFADSSKIAEGSFTRKWFLGEGDSSTNTFF